MSGSVFERYKEALKSGHVAVLRGRPKEALAHYVEAAALADHRALPYLSMGSVLLQLGRARDALAAYDDALRRAPDDTVAHRGRASALRALGRAAEAADAERSATAIEEAAERARRAAIAAEQEAARLADPETLVHDADAALLRRDTEMAVGRFVAAAEGHTAAGRVDAGLDAAHRALRLAPGAAPVHLAMVEAYLARGWDERAAERLLLLDRLLTLDPEPAARARLDAFVAAQQSLEPRLAALAGGREADTRAGGSTAVSAA